MKIHEQLKQARISANMTQVQLAQAIGTYQANIAEIESGRKSPNLKTVQKIVDATGISITINPNRTI